MLLSDVHLPNSHLKSLHLPNVTNYYSKNLNERHKTQNVSNILYNSMVDKQRSGDCGVIKQGLTHLAIPNGWSWGGCVSPYCPVWIELFVNPVEVTDL